MKKVLKILAIFISVILSVGGVVAVINKSKQSKGELQRVELINLQDELSSLKERLNGSTEILYSLNVEMDELTGLHDGDMAILEETHRADVEKMEAFAESLVAMYDEQQVELDEIAGALDSLEVRLTEMEADTASLQEEVARLQTGVTILEKALEDLQEDFGELDVRIDELATELGARIDALEAINARAGYGWEYVEGYTNHVFSVENEGVTHSGFTNVVSYENKADTSKRMIIADIYVTGAETVEADAIKLALATVGYEWRSTYLPVLFTMPSAMHEFLLGCPYIEIETYSWLLDTTANIGKLNGNGTVWYSLASSQNDVGYWHYVQGLAMELDTYNTGALTVLGKHITVRLYNKI